MSETARALTAFVASAIGLALVATVLSRNANTAGVISAGSQGLAGIIGAATAPVTGGAVSSGGFNLGNFGNAITFGGALG